MLQIVGAIYKMTGTDQNKEGLPEDENTPEKVCQRVSLGRAWRESDKHPSLELGSG